MSTGVSLGQLRAAYKRTSSRIYRILEDGYDFSIENALIESLDRDALIIDAAFFVLIFGQIENRINELAARRLTAERRRALRSQRFEQRMTLALPGRDHQAVRDDITHWYNLRNDAAHGERLATHNIGGVLERADQLDVMLSERPERP